MRRVILLAVVMLAGCTSPWVHKEYGKVRRGDDRLNSDYAECQKDEGCMNQKGWSFRGRRAPVWFNQDVPQDQMARRFKMDQAKCRTMVLTAPGQTGRSTGAAMLMAATQQNQIMSSCLESLGWEQVRGN